MIDREIASQARDLVKDQRQQTADHEEESKYRSLCESLPILLRTAGLTRTVTFLDAKKSAKEAEALLDHLGRQLERVGIYSDANRRILDLPRLVVSKNLETPDYRHISIVALRVAYWHKRLARRLAAAQGGWAMSACRLPVRVQEAQHKGLFLDKFLPGKREKGQSKEQVDPQAEALRALAVARCDTAVYKLAYARWRDYWMTRGDNVVCSEGVVRDRLAIGLGMESVLENGVRLQHSYGTPVIPGSSLKGILRRGLAPEHRDEQREDRRNVEWYLFGSTKREGAARFYDAWWVPDANPPLALDVLTPHHQEYMQRKGAPTDFDTPVPVHFLTVRGKYLFVVEAPNPSWREYLKALLADVLKREGIGAKRSTGYGVIDVR